MGSMHLTFLMHCKDVGQNGTHFWTYPGVKNFASKYGFEGSPPAAGDPVSKDQLQHIQELGVDLEAKDKTDFGDGILVPCTSDWIQRHMEIFGVGFENIAYQRNGRPHFGKENHAKSSYLSKAYPRYTDFMNLRNELDPK